MIATDVAPGRADGAAPRSSIWQGGSAVGRLLRSWRSRRRRAPRSAPPQAALLPRLARTPAELTAANVASSTLEAIGDVRRAGARRRRARALRASQAVFARQRRLVRLVGGARARGPRAPRRADRSRDGARCRATEPPRAVVGGRASARSSRAGTSRPLTALYTAQTLVAGALERPRRRRRARVARHRELGCRLSQRRARRRAASSAASSRSCSRHAAGWPRDFGLGVVLFGLPLVLVGPRRPLPVALLALAVDRARELARRHQRPHDHAANRARRRARPGARGARGHPARSDRRRRAARARC